MSKSIWVISLILLTSFHFAFASDLSEEAKQHYAKGKEYYQQAKYKEAKEEFQKALDIVSQEGQKPAEEASPAPGKSSEYIIGEEDTVYIHVWQDKDLCQEMTVQPDGKISLPLAGEIPVLGITLTQLKKEITLRLSEYIKDPVVTVSLRKIGGRKVILLGEVSSPGVYPISGATSVLELIALAHGFTRDAICSNTILIRGGLVNPKGMKLNLTRAINKAVPSQNIALEPGDIVFVPKKFIADANYFMNQIISPITQGVSLYDIAKRFQ